MIVSPIISHCTYMYPCAVQICVHNKENNKSVSDHSNLSQPDSTLSDKMFIMQMFSMVQSSCTAKQYS